MHLSSMKTQRKVTVHFQTINMDLLHIILTECLKLKIIIITLTSLLFPPIIEHKIFFVHKCGNQILRSVQEAEIKFH